MKRQGLRAVLWLVLALSLIGSALSAPPFIETSSGSLQVISAHPLIFKHSASNSELYFHIYNSTFSQLNNTQTNCSIHTYNISNGQHLSEAILLKHSTNDWEYRINWSVYEKGTYEYLVTCNTVGMTPQEFGFLRNAFSISNTGEQILFENFILGMSLVFLPLIIAFLMLYWGLALGEEHTVLKIFISVFAQITSIFSFVIAILNINKFSNWPEMINVLSISVIVMSLIAFVILTYWCIYLFRTATKALAEAKLERLRY